ncbi:MAG: T9SS type A sorting domain-containing protein [Bacteroidales bacterium]|nr:T9SS type A sorting domain-containing protein [Bacteroidales bacterium]
MKKILLIITLLLPIINNSWGQQYRFEYKFHLHLANDDDRYYIRNARIILSNNTIVVIPNLDLYQGKGNIVKSNIMFIDSPVQEMLMNTSYQDEDCVLTCWWDTKCEMSNHYIYRRYTDGCMKPKTATANFGCLNHNGGHVDVETFACYPVMSLTSTIINNIGQEVHNNYFPLYDRLVIKATAGFPINEYRWEYSIGNENNDTTEWQNVPSTFYNGYTFSASAKEFLENNAGNMINKRVFFRINLECGHYTNTLSFIIIPSAPHIENVIPIMPTCHGDEDGKLIIKFDRALYSDSCDGNYQNTCLEEELWLTRKNNITGYYEIIEGSSKLMIAPETLTSEISGLPAGTYHLGLYGKMLVNNISPPINTYTEGENHYKTAIIPERPALKLESLTADSVHCYGGSDGKIYLKVSGGVGKFSAFLINGAKPVDTIENFVSNATVTFFNLQAGTYTVEIADTNGCTRDINGNNLIYNITVGQPSMPVKINGIYEWEEPKCFGNSDGWAQIHFNGGTGSYTVVWTDTTGAVIPNVMTSGSGITSSRVENIRAGKYLVTVRDSHYSLANPATEPNRCGCYDTMTVTITQPPLLEVSVEETHYVTCYGDSDGVLMAHGTGGRPFSSGNPYNYEWSKIVNGISSTVGTNDSILNDLYSGLYAVKITDRNAICIALDTFYLPQPDTLTVKTEVLQNVLCSGESSGAISSEVTGGTPPYTYIWSNGETTPEIHNLSIGGYVVYVRDARYADNGILGHYCTAQAQAFITSPNGIEFNATVTNPTCNSYSNGSIVLNVTGGMSPYFYLWENGSSENSRTELPAGVYTVTVTDANGCIILQTYTLNEPEPVIVDLGKDITLCKNQTVKIYGNINISNAYYEWTDETGTVLSYLPEYELTKAGIYQLTATTQEGCFDSDELTVFQSEDEIDVDFVIATKVANNTKLYAVNITRLSLDDIEWIIPAGAVLHEETEDRIQLQFAKNGTYIVGLKGYKGKCEKTLYKTISVVDKNEINEDENAEPFLKRFIVVPNPNDGNFDAIIELREAAEFRLVLYDMSGTIVETTPTYNAISQTVHFNRSVISAGTYLLKFISSKTVSVFKIIIQ